MTLSDNSNPRISVRPAFSLRFIHYLLFGGLIVLLLVLLGLSLVRSSLERQLAVNQANRQRCLQIAEEMRRNWDELAHMARLFVATGNPAYEGFFNQILAIRDGQAPRPADYDKVYWDLVVALGHQPPATGPAVSMDAQMKSAGFTSAELANAEESNRQSGQYILDAQVAMNAAKGIFRNSQGRFTLTSKPNIDYADRLLNSLELQQARIRIMKPLLDLQILLDDRTRLAIQKIQTSLIYKSRMEAGAGVLLLLFAIAAAIVLNRRIVEPMTQLAASAVAVGRNGFFRRLLVTRADELGAVAGALNRMSETVEEKLAESAAAEERCRHLLEATADAMIISDAESRIIQVNHQAESFLGYSRDELVGQPLEIITPAPGTPADGSTLLTSGPATAAPGPRRIARRKDGVEVPVDIKVSPLVASNGSQLVCTVIRDLSDQQGARSTYDTFTAFHAALLDAVSCPMFTLNARGEIAGCNRAYELAFGVTRESLVGKSARDLPSIPESTNEGSIADYNEVIRTGGRRSIEMSVTYQDRAEYRVVHTMEAIRLPDGQPGGLVGLLVDITEQQSALTELNEQRHLLQSLINHADTCIYVKDVDGRYVFVNQPYEQLSGLSAEALTGRTAADVFGADRGAELEASDREVRQSREVLERMETFIVDGEPRAFHWRKFPLVNPTGELFGTAGILRETDTTEPAEQIAHVEAMDRVHSDDPEPTLSAEPEPYSPPVETPEEIFPLENPAEIQPAAATVPAQNVDLGTDEAEASATQTESLEGTEDPDEPPATIEIANEPPPVIEDLRDASVDIVVGQETGEHEKPEPTPPARKPRAARKRKAKAEAQPDLFGGYDLSKDEAGPVKVTIEPDGVPAVPGLDLRDAMNRAGIPLAAIKELAVHFADGLPKSIAELRATLAIHDHDNARRHAHTLAGTAGTLSADTMRRLAKTLELGLKFEQGDFDRMLSDLEREAARLAEGIRQFSNLDLATVSVVEQPAGSASLEYRKLQTVLEELATALDDGDIESIGQAVAALKSSALPADVRTSYDRLSELVDGFDYAEAAEVVREMQSRLK